MEGYENKTKMRRQLTTIGSILSAKQKEEIARIEGVSVATVRNYLAGAIGVLALAEKIIERGNAMIESKKQGA